MRSQDNHVKPLKGLNHPMTFPMVLGLSALGLFCIQGCQPTGGSQAMRLAAIEGSECRIDYQPLYSLALTVSPEEIKKYLSAPPGPPIAFITAPPVEQASPEINSTIRLMELTRDWDYIGNRNLFGTWSASIELARNGEIRAVSPGDRIGEVLVESVDGNRVVLSLDGAQRELIWNAKRVAEEREAALQKDLVKKSLAQARLKYASVEIPQATPLMTWELRKQAEAMRGVQSVLTQLDEQIDTLNLNQGQLDILVQAAELQYQNLKSSLDINETTYDIKSLSGKIIRVRKPN